MEQNTLTYNFNFNGVDVTVYHHPRYLCSSDHVEWRSVPCSVTETGYYSMWLPVTGLSPTVSNIKFLTSLAVELTGNHIE